MPKPVRLLPLVLALGVTLAGASPTWAVPAPGVLRTIEQPDGHSFVAAQRGDEHVSWVETETGHTVARGEDGFWYYVRGYSGSRPLLTQRRAHRPPPVVEGEPVRPEFPWYPPEESFDLGRLHAGELEPAVVMILVEYDDAPASFADLDDWAPKLDVPEDPEARTVIDYYRDASNDVARLRPAGEGDGDPNDGVIGWLRISGPHPNPGQYARPSQAEADAKGQIFRDAIEGADPHIDFASFDVAPADGILTPQELAILVVASGHDQSRDPSASPSVWPQKNTVILTDENGDLETFDGVLLEGAFAIMAEIQRGVDDQVYVPDHSSTLGVMVHELGHLIFGLPDLYDVEGSSQGIGAYGVMGTGWFGHVPGEDLYDGETPVLPSAWSLYRLEWAHAKSPVELHLVETARDVGSGAASSLQVGVAPLFDSPDGVVGACSRYEYFLAQYRTYRGYDRGLEAFIDLSSQDGGVAIFHVDERMPDNSFDSRRLVDVEEADGGTLSDADGEQIDDLWFTGHATDFDDVSNPSSDFNRSTSGPTRPSHTSIKVDTPFVNSLGEEAVGIDIRGPCVSSLVAQPVPGIP